MDYYNFRENTDFISKRTSKAALYELLAEEAAELSHAAAKAGRILRGEVPTPNTLEKAEANVLEEYADVEVVLEVMDVYADPEMEEFKMNRWAQRLKEKEQQT